MVKALMELSPASGHFENAMVVQGFVAFGRNALCGNHHIQPVFVPNRRLMR